MPAALEQSRFLARPSVSKRDLIPDLGLATATVAATAAVQWMVFRRLGGGSPLLLFAATAAALTFWRGLGPGMLASSLGSTIGPSLYAGPGYQFNGEGPLDGFVLCTVSLFMCWLIYRLRVQQEDAQTIQSRQNDALSFVSHELRQPLLNIMLVSGILERDASEKARNMATRMILRSTTRMATLIDDLTEVTRLQGNSITLDATELRLQDIIQAAIEATRPAIEQKRQQLTIDVALDQPLWINGDAMRLEQALGNLLSNACKYSPEGAEISISSREEQGRAIVVVRDTGVGIKWDKLEAIFEPFVRESPGMAEGLGIGLTLVRTLITQHGGRVSAHSDGPGRGSEFMIELPLLATTPEEAARDLSA